MKRALIATLGCVLGLALTGCGQANKDPLQVSASASAARPANVPTTQRPAGTRVDTHGRVLDTVTSGHALFVATPTELRIYRSAEPTASPRTVRLPGKPGHLTALRGGVLVPVPTRHTVLTVTASGTAEHTRVPGAPTGAVRTADGALVAAIPQRHGIAVLRNGEKAHFITGDLQPEQLYRAGGTVVALDPKRTAIYEVDLAAGKFGTGMRAGQGASEAATDQYGRLLIPDARKNQLLAFSTDPPLLRQRFPIENTPFGIAYDRTHRIIWVTLTGSNQVAGYGVGRGQPEPKYRFPTVGSPNSVAVDPRSGTVFIGSAAHDGLAVVHP